MVNIKEKIKDNNKHDIKGIIKNDITITPTQHVGKDQVKDQA